MYGCEGKGGGCCNLGEDEVRLMERIEGPARS